MAELIKILLVEDDPMVCESFHRVCGVHPNLAIAYTTDSEQEALNYLLGHRMDVIILDIELAEGDGISFLERLLEQEEEKPFIVVVTNTSSEVLLGYLRAHGADYVYQKNNTAYSAARILGIIERVYPYQKAVHARGSLPAKEQLQQDKEAEILRRYVEEELEQMGFRRRQTAFAYLVDALLFVMERPKDFPPSMTGELYPMIAARYQVTKASVERAMRHAIEVVFARMDAAQRSYYYPYPFDEAKGRPSNLDFLLRVAERIAL